MVEPKEPPSYAELESASADLAKKNAALEAKLKQLSTPSAARKAIVPRDPQATDRFVRTYDGR